MRLLFTLGLVSTALSPALALGQALPAPVFLDEVVLPTALAIEGVPVGGISGLDYDPAADVFYAVSDDRAQFGPARFYVLRLAIDATGITRLDIAETHELTGMDGVSFPERGVDPEAIRFDAHTNTLIWTSEGNASGNPEIYEADLTGNALRAYDVPAAYLVGAEGHGIYNNLSFEALALSADGSLIYVGTENGLQQDGGKATLEAGSPARIAVLDRESGDLISEFIYMTDPIRIPATEEPGYNDNGLSEMLLLDDGRLVTVERTFASGYGNEIAFYVTDLSGATDIAGVDTITDMDITLAEKAHWFTIGEGDFGLDIDNIESLTFGPEVDGQRTLVIASDNNFNRDGQFTQFVVFTLP